MADELDLKNMSPEQIRELQKKQCIFCRITEGKVQAKKVYEDEHVIAVLDINPGTPGHMLVMPREHYSILPQIPEEIVAHLGRVARHLSQAALRALKAQGTSIFAANGLAAGQRASHFLLHVIPRMEGDGAGISPPEGTVSEKDAQALHNSLKPLVDRLFGKQPSVPDSRIEKPEKTDQPKKDAKSNLDDIADFLSGGK